MAYDHLDLPDNTLGYSYNMGGLNNQKLALFGLFLKAHREGPRQIVLPDFLVYDMVSYNHIPVPLDQALRLDPLRDFAARHGIEILDISPRGDKGGGVYFHYGNNYIPHAALLNELAPDSFTCDFFRSLVPAIQGSDLLHRVADATFGQRGIRLVAQLRIERDWIHHTAYRLKPTVGDTEHNLPSFMDIITKISNTLPDDAADIYVVCDEAALPVAKDEIRTVVKQEFNINLFWKSDFLAEDEFNGLSPMDLSILDFEMALAAEGFVGLTRSTFSNMVTLERYARTRAPVERHYVYNMHGPYLALRTDNGAFSVPELAAATDPWAAQYNFSLAQIFHASGDRHRALEHYAAWAASGGPEREERFICLYRAAQIKSELGFSAADVVDTYVRATEIFPSRAEGLHGASRHCRYNHMSREGFELALRAVEIPMPHSALFPEPWIYEYGILDELAINAYWCGHYWECADASLKILSGDKIPDDQRPRIIGNAQLGLGHLRPPSPEAPPHT